MNKELAIKLLRGSVLGTNEQLHEAVFMAIKALKDEPKHGYWALEPDSEPYTEYICSVCGTRASSFIGGSEMWYCLSKPHFCPSCGTKMDKENKE